jgi:hypothetical protein
LVGMQSGVASAESSNGNSSQNKRWIPHAQTGPFWGYTHQSIKSKIFFVLFPKMCFYL